MNLVLLSKKLYKKEKASSEKLVGATISVISYDEKSMCCLASLRNVTTQELLEAYNKKLIHPVNFTIKSNGVIIHTKYNNTQELMEKVLGRLRSFMEAKYGTGTNLCGRCIEASCYVETILGAFGVPGIKQVEGYCLWDNEEYGSDRPYDEHTWVEIANRYYVDITADQFNPGFSDKNHFKPIEFRSRTPKEMRSTKPIEGEDYWIYE